MWKFLASVEAAAVCQVMISGWRKVSRVSKRLACLATLKSCDTTELSFRGRHSIYIYLRLRLRFALAKHTTTHNIYNNIFLFSRRTLVWSRSNEVRYKNRSSMRPGLFDVSKRWPRRCTRDNDGTSLREQRNFFLVFRSIRRPNITIKLPRGNMDVPPRHCDYFP